MCNQVKGTILTVKKSLSTSFTVSETPSTETEPFGAKYFKKSLFILKVILSNDYINFRILKVFKNKPEL